MRILVKKHAAKKIEHFVDLTDGEISGLCKSKFENGIIIIEDALILNQVCTAASTDLDEDAMIECLGELIERGENPEEWNVWWHSHAKMQTFWSTTDDETIKNHCGIQKYLISIVTNKAGDYKGRIDLFPKDESPFNVNVKYKEDLKVELEDNDIFEIYYDDLSEDFKKLNDDVLSEYKDNKEPISSFEVEYNPIELLESCVEEINKKVTVIKPKYVYNTGSSKYQRPHFKSNTIDLFDDEDDEISKAIHRNKTFNRAFGSDDYEDDIEEFCPFTKQNKV